MDHSGPLIGGRENPGDTGGETVVGIRGTESHESKGGQGGGKYGRGGRISQERRQRYETNRDNVAIINHRDGSY